VIGGYTRGTVVVAGHVCIDLHPRLDAEPRVIPGQLIDVGPLRMRSGGCVANTGLDLASLGTAVRLEADVGDDDLGHLLVGLLNRPGVEGRGVRMSASAETSYSIVIQPPAGDRSFWHHVGANALFTGESISLDGVDLLHVGYTTILPELSADGGRRLIRLLTRAREGGTTTSMDLATVDPRSVAAEEDWSLLLARVLPLVDVFAPSLDDLVSIGRGRSGSSSRHLAGELVSDGVAVAMVKDGANGLHLRTGGRERLADGGRALAPLAASWAEADEGLPALQVPVLGTTGAGDAAVAGLLHALYLGLSPLDAARTATLAAAVRVARHGPLPAATELEAALAELGVGPPGDPAPARLGPSQAVRPDDPRRVGP